MRVITATALCVSIVGLATAADVEASIRRAVNIPSQGLGPALQAFAQDHDLHVVFIQEDVSSLSTSGASGDLTIDEALRQLLNGTGLTYRHLDEKTLTIVPVNGSGARDSASVRGELSGDGASAARTDVVMGMESAAQRIRLAQADQSTTDGAGGATAASARSYRDELEEVIVTANKRREKVQDVAASITVLGSEQIERLHATSIQEYATYVPGMVIEGGVNPGMQGIALRGLAAHGNKAMVGTYLDETPVGSEVAVSFDASLQFDMMPYDLDRVEVLRGPQGTLYGASSMGGIVKYVTRAPDLDTFESRAGAEIFAPKGSDDIGHTVRGAVNLPVVDGKLAVRASLYNKETPGFIDNYLTGEEDQNDVSQYGGRMALLWQATDALSVKASVISQTISADNGAIVRMNYSRVSEDVYTPFGPIGGDLTNGNPLPEPFERKMNLYNLTLDWDLGWAHALSISSYTNADVHSVIDQSQILQTIVPNRLMGFHLYLDDQRYTQEIRLMSPSGSRFEWMTGVYYNKQTSDFYEELTMQLPTDRSLVPGFNPLATVSAPVSYREMAGFGNVTYRFTRAFDLSLGLRWARNEQNYHQITVPNPNLPVAARTDSRQESSESVVTYAVTPRYYLNENTMLYASVSNGYRPGGPNVYSPNQPEIPTQVNADTITNYEAGFKSDFLDGRATIQFALFRMDWEDIQLSVSGGTGFSYGVNGGTARSQGGELAAGFSLTKALSVNVTAAHMDAYLTEDVPEEEWKSGDGLSVAPKWSGSFTANYDFPAFGAWNGRVSGGWRYVGQRTPSVDRGNGNYKLNSYSAVDASIGLSNGPWDLSLYGRNLGDHRVYIARGPIGSVFSGSPLQPRRIGLSVDYKF